MVRHLRGLPADDRQQIEAAIAAAESRSHARFLLTVVPASDRYGLYPVLYAALIALLAAGLLAWVKPAMDLRYAFAAEGALFAVLSVLLEWRPLRLALVPPRVKREHASHLAHRLFAARILAHPERPGGILIFISEAERYVELLADHATHTRVGEAQWQAIVQRFSAQMRSRKASAAVLEAVEACATLLEQHYPKSAR